MVTNDLKQVLIAYKSLVRRQPWAKNTQDANRFQLLQYREYLAIRPSTVDHPLCHPLARDYTVQDFKRYLQAVQRAKPALVNLTLAAIDHVYQFFGLDRVRVLREDLPKITPRALNPEEQKAFLHAVERSPSLHDQALARLLFYMGMRLSECAFFNANDIIISARKGLVIGRSGNEESYREVPLNAEARKTLSEWLTERGKAFGTLCEPTLFLKLKRRQMSTRAIDLVPRQFGRDVKLKLAAHVLRHTCLTNLVRRDHDLVLVAEVTGHKRRETTHRYRLPSLEDRESSMGGLRLGY